VDLASGNNHFSKEQKMPSTSRNVYDEAFKTKVVLESLEKSKTINELSSKYGVHPNQITQWRTHFLSNASELFKKKTSKDLENEQLRKENEKLVHQIGEQAVDINFLKKNLRKLNLL